MAPLVRLKILVLGALILLMIVLTTVLAVVWTLPEIEKFTQWNLCLTDDDGKVVCDETEYTTDHFLKKKLRQSRVTRKAHKEKEIEEYFQKHRVQLMQIYKANTLDMKPSAKLVGSNGEQAEGKEAMTTVLTWNAGRAIRHTTGFQRYGVDYKNGRLIVPVSGTYYIYSNLELYETCDSKSGEPEVRDISRPLAHCLNKFSMIGHEDIEIVANTQAHKTSSNTHFNYYNSYISTLAQLNAGDEISVKVSNVSLLRYPDGNFFGLNLI